MGDLLIKLFEQVILKSQLRFKRDESVFVLIHDKLALTLFGHFEGRMGIMLLMDKNFILFCCKDSEKIYAE